MPSTAVNRYGASPLIPYPDLPTVPSAWIARALVSCPKIVLADEPTAALDKTSGRDGVDTMHDLAKQQGCPIG